MNPMLEAFKNRKKLTKKKSKEKKEDFKKVEAHPGHKLHSKPKMKIVIGFGDDEDEGDEA